jgi:FAD/FMN-containing dehydrogenase
MESHRQLQTHRAVRVAREFNLTVSVRSGGHSATGLSVLGQIVIDLAKTLNTVWVLEPDATHPHPYVRVDAGARIADIDEITARRGYVTPLGAYQVGESWIGRACEPDLTV